MNFLDENRGLKDNWIADNIYFLAVALILAFGVIQTTGTALETDNPVVTVVSCSMYPEYKVGDVVMVKGESFENINEGDVIVFDAESQEVDIPVIHRVISKGENSLETQGDNTQGQNEFEKDIRPDQIHGKAFFSIPRVGLVKLGTMDILGLTGQPFVFDSIPACERVN